MIINASDESSLIENTYRSFLLDKSSIQPDQSFQPSKLELYKIIRDKAICQDLSQVQVIESAVSRFYNRFEPIRPEGHLIVVWNISVMMIILFYILQLPLVLGYGEVAWQQISTHLLPVFVIFYLILLIDIVITPLKMFYRQGLLVKDRRILLKQYLNTYFWIDVIGLISLVVPQIFMDYYAVNLISILFLPKVMVLNKLDQKIGNVLIVRTRAKTLYLIGRLVVFLILISHYIGIGFFMVSYYVYATNYYGPNTPNICWIYNAQAYSQIILLLDWKGQYAYTMYFSLGMTTTIAYGDITPLNPLETLYIVFALIITCLAFGYILAEVMRILIEAFYAEFNMDNLKFTMENLLVINKVKPKLKQLIRAHMEQIATEQMYRNRDIQRQVISTLPYNLQIALYGKIYQEFIENIKISPDPFCIDKNRNSRFIEKIVLQITEARYLVGDLIYKENQFHIEQFKNHKVYFLKDISNIQDIVLGVGKNPSVDFKTKKIQNQNQFILFYHGRPFFGQVQFFTGGSRSHWAMCKSNILLYELSRNSFLNNLRYTSRKQLEYLSELRQTISHSYCYICYENHDFKKCTRTTFIPDIFEAVLRVSQNQKMQRRHNLKIQNVRTQKRTTSAKTNALRIFNQSKKAKDKKSLEKSKIRLLTTSKHYRKVYHEQEHEDSQSCSSSSNGTSEDLDNMIYETKMLIEHLDEVGHEEEVKEESPMFDYQFDEYYHFKGYKPQDNWDNVLSRYSDTQKIIRSKKRVSMMK